MATESFSLQIDQFVAKAKGNIQEFVSEFLQDLNEDVVRNTPVDTGFLRGSWWSAIGGPQIGGTTPDKAGATAIARMNLVASQVVVGQIYYAMNGAAYAGFVEYGTSRMAPRAFVRSTLARAPAMAEAAAKRVAAR